MTLPPLIYLPPRFLLPEDTMEDNSDRLSAMERELGSQCQSLNDICNQLITLIALSGGVNCSLEAPLQSQMLWLHPSIPRILLPIASSLQLLVRFTGDHTKGHAFLKSCRPIHWAGPYPVRQ